MIMHDRKLYSVKKFFLISGVILLLPFATLSVYFALHTIQSSEEMVASANRNALYLYQQELSSNLEQLELLIAQSWAQDWDYKKLRFQQEAIDAHESTRKILESYKTIQSVYSCVGSMAVYSKANDLCRCVYYNNYPHDLREDIKKYVADIDFSKDSRTWYTQKISDKWFLVRILGTADAYSACLVDIDLGPAFTYEEPVLAPTYLIYFNQQMEPMNEADLLGNAHLTFHNENYYYTQRISGDNYMVVHIPLGYGKVTMSYIARYSGFRHMTFSQMFAVLLTFLMLLLIPFVYYIMIRIFFQPLSNFIHTMRESRQDNIHPRLSYDGLLVELNEFSGTFNHMMDKIEQLKIDSYEQEMAKQKAEFQYLQQQLKPHFYLNCLKMLYGIIQLKHTDKAQQMILGISEYIRYTFRNNSILVPLEQEVRQVENYVHIQRESIATKVLLSIDIPSEAKQIHVPIMCIQTFVENSFKYGVCPDRNLEIRISANIISADQESYLDISIQDNGCGFPEEALENYTKNRDCDSGTATGIRNLRQRLEIFYQSKAGITCMNDYQGALCELIIPLHKESHTEQIQEVTDECIDH